jgi:crotonobetainyl-CoA:carnitine CoA-transferase CaiB-like acyl-CoA transferase
VTQANGATPLEGLLVVDLSEGIPGAYCTKWLADAGAEVVKLEPPSGDPLRRWAIGATVPKGVDGALFQFLAGHKRSVVIDVDRPEDVGLAESLIAASDITVWSPGRLGVSHGFTAAALHDKAPASSVIAITPFGLTGPWSGRPATELTLQAWSGGIAGRGSGDRPPVHIGGRPGQWLTGITAAVAALTAHQRGSVTGRGELVDVSILETMTLMLQMYPVVRKTMLPPPTAEEVAAASSVPARNITIPSVVAASDGWVGFMVATSTQWEMFSLMVGHPEWPEDNSTYLYRGRAARRAELEGAIAEWVGARTVAEVLQTAQDLRVPAAPIGTGATVTTFDHFVEGKFFLPNAGGAFIQPDVPYTLSTTAGRLPPEPSPRLDKDGAAERATRRQPKPVGPVPDRPTGLPLAGMRVADFTAFWAGPIVGHYLAMLGADVIHVESTGHPDGIRAHTIKTVEDDQWWEYSPLFSGPNTNKRGVTIDMSKEEGRELAFRLIEHCDVVLENYTPRVMEHWGIDYEKLRAVRPDVVFLRMPAFGLKGPWRDRTGYAQTMEQASGLAWVTGFPDGPPVVPNGMCDPLAGTHATAALLIALDHRRRTGEGMQVEVAMIGGALNVAAEQVIEYTAYGHLMERDGNRGLGAPQNLYLAADVGPGGLRDTWIALEVETNEQWEALRCAMDDPSWAADPNLAEDHERRVAADRIDKHLADWCATRLADDIVETLWPAGVPVGRVIVAQDADLVEQHVARRFFEPVTHPLTGENSHPGYPARSDAGPTRCHRSPAPTLGQHNVEVFRDILGLTGEELALLEKNEIIGSRLKGVHRAR